MVRPLQRASWHAILPLCFLACADEIPVPQPTLTNDWNLEETVPGAEAGLCTTHASLRLDSAAGGWRALVRRELNICSFGAADTLDASLIGDSIALWNEQCTYIGRRDPDGDSIAGELGCFSYLSGTWVAQHIGPPAVVQVTPAERVLVRGAQSTLTAEVRDAEDRVRNVPVLAWSSSASAVASVDSSGRVTAVATGTAIIEARAGDATGTATIEVRVPGFVSVSAGGEHTCALDASGSAWCWGDNQYGQLGDGSGTISTAPVAVRSDPGPFTSVVAGRASTCGLQASGQLWCWGSNGGGRLGDGTTTARGTPVAVAGGHLFAQVAVGATYTCARTAAGQAYCWGWNSAGQLGDSTFTTRLVPTPVRGALAFTTLAAGWETTCGLTATGQAYCWGANGWGQAGIGSPPGDSIVLWPKPVAGGLTFASVAVGRLHACGLTATGEAWCWGGGVYGQLGTGSRAGVRQPDVVAGGHTFTSITTSQDHTCAVDTDGKAWCWGANGAGRSGHSVATEVDVPTAVDGALTVGALSAGGVHSCGRTTAGVLWCWGFNFRGEVGDGTRTDRYAPVRVLGQP